LYGPIAQAWHAGSHRAISIRLTALRMGAKQMRITDQYRADASAVSLRMLTNTRLVVNTPSIVRIRQASSARQGVCNLSRRLTRFQWSAKSALSELRGRRASAPSVNLSLRKLRRGSTMAANAYEFKERRSSAPPKVVDHQRRMAMRAPAPPAGTQLGGRRRSSALHPTVTTIDRLSVYVQQWGMGSVQQCAHTITRASETTRGATDSLQRQGSDSSGSCRRGEEVGTQCCADSMPTRRSPEPSAGRNECGCAPPVCGCASPVCGRAPPERNAQNRPLADKAQIGSLRRSDPNDDFNVDRRTPIRNDSNQSMRRSMSMKDMMLLERQEVIGGGSSIGAPGSPSTPWAATKNLNLTKLDTSYSPPKVRGPGGANAAKDVWSSTRRSD